MDTKKKILFALGGSVGLYALAYLIGLLVVKLAERKAFGKDDPKDGKTSSGSNNGGSGWNNFPLKWGSGTCRNKHVSTTNWAVKQIQLVCNGWVKSGLAVDGVWGDKTEAAVQKLKTVRARPKNTTAVYGGYNMAAYSATINPFDSYISSVQNPASSISKVQVTNNSNFKSIIDWHNANVKKYVKVV